ncbi:hypothetical protein IR128_11280 [Staphylococcus lentus]|nr:hypothetical protein [Mammaliicoccus lentus]MBF0842291.1 hypothetical protein [Mammaliicoccus lentus]
MRQYNEIEKHLNYIDENLIKISELGGQWHICGKALKGVDLPNGQNGK